MIGYRSWSINTTKDCLVGAYGAEWYGKNVKSDVKPAKDNTAGIYSYQYPAHSGIVFGMVDASGQILVHDDGVIRSQYASILWLACRRRRMDEKRDDEVAVRVRSFCARHSIRFVELSEVNSRISQPSSNGDWNISAEDSQFSLVALDSNNILEYQLFEETQFMLRENSIDHILLNMSLMGATTSDFKKQFSLDNRLLSCIKGKLILSSLDRLRTFGLVRWRGADPDESVLHTTASGLEVLETVKRCGFFDYNSTDAKFRPCAYTRSLNDFIMGFVYKLENNRWKLSIGGKVYENSFDSLKECIHFIKNDFFPHLFFRDIDEKEIISSEEYYEVNYWLSNDMYNFGQVIDVWTE